MSLNNDFILFKNEILKDIRDFQKKITEQMTSKNITIDTDLERIHGKLEQLISSNKTTSQKLIEHQVKFLLVIVIGRLFVNVIGWSKEKTEKVSQLGPNLAPRSSIQLGSETTKVLKEIEDKKDERAENGDS